jgi:hypothetical protein
MSVQTYAQRPVQSSNKMREAFYRTQDEQYDRMAYKARRAVKRAKAIRQEAETFLASLDV